MTLNTLEQALFQELSHQADHMVETLITWSKINSGTSHLAGLKTMHDTLYQAFSVIADDVQSIPSAFVESIDLKGNRVTKTYGHTLFIRKRPHLSRRILLSGHMDTVFPQNSPFQTPQFLEKNILNGPGVADMKGGLVVLLHALSAFEQTPFAKNLGWDLIINADEEIGSFASSQFYEALIPNYKLALVYEPAMNKEGMFAKNRKGSGKFTLIAKGVAAHAGRNFHDGKNAIVYLAEALLEIQELNHIQENITINIGQIQGGEALNVVPDKAVAKLDVRIKQTEDESWFREQMHQIMMRLQRNGYELSLEGHFQRPVKRINLATQKLFERLQKIGQSLNLSFDWQDSGGCCDGNNFSKYGLAVIDTLGVRGGSIHSEQEFICIDSLVERSMLSCMLLIDLADKSLEEITSTCKVHV